jgi:hypothetical protein
MRKSMLSALVLGTSVLAMPAFAQVSLGGAAQVGAGVHAGSAVPGAVHDVAGQATAQTERTLHRVGSHAKHKAHKVAGKSASTANDAADANASGTAGAGAGDSHANANARVDAGEGLDTAATAGKAGDMGHGVGGEVRDAAHSAIQSTDRAAGSVGDAVKGLNAGASGNASGNVNANAHGH